MLRLVRFFSKFKSLKEHTKHFRSFKVDGHQVLVEKEWAIDKDDDYQIVITIVFDVGMKARWTMSYKSAYKMEKDFEGITYKFLYHLLHKMKEEYGIN